MGLSLIAAATLGIVISLLVLGGPERDFTATAYSDVIRFQAEGVATLQVRIFDLSGKEVWDSGMVSGDIVDWDRRNDFGERLAYGAYIYSAQGWNAEGDVIFQKNGKLALMPGDKVQLQVAPVVMTPQSDDGLVPFRDESFTFQPKAVNVDHSGESWAFGQVGIGTTSPVGSLTVASGGAAPEASAVGVTPGIALYDSGKAYFLARDVTNNIEYLMGTSDSGVEVFMGSMTDQALSLRTNNQRRVWISATGNVGIGTTSPTAKLEIESSTGQDLIAAYPSSARVAGSAVFIVKSTGEVRADGAYYGASFNTVSGAADVAERINTSEWMEAGCVVEIDPDHPGFFRKSSSPYSTKVAGIISTSPGVILGNSFDEATDDWEDNRPVLAIAGRVPLQVTVENGPIQIGDLLVSSSTPGVAMRGSDAEACMGTVVGKAMEPLENGEGTIVVQIMLR
jgi:hypothetical protein